MLRANNEALFQNTNFNVVSIRQQEIAYYVSVYQSFATQAALIGGFTYGVLQNATKGPNWVPDLDFFYGITASVTILCSIHVILCCLFLQVYGPGLSLYGKAGSMARACDVLRKEQPMVIKSFLLMLLFFSASTVALFWTVLDYLAATVCSTALVFAVRYWWIYSHRIYAQLSWEYDTTDSMAAGEGRDTLGDFLSKEINENPLSRLQREHQLKHPTHSSHNDVELGGMKGTSPSSSSSKISSVDDSKSQLSAHDILHARPVDFTTANTSILLEGYLTRRFLSSSSSKRSSLASLVSPSSSGSIQATKPERRYYLLLSNGYLLSYKDRKDYRDNYPPKSSSSLSSSKGERPVELADFLIFDDLSKCPKSEVRDYINLQKLSFSLVLFDRHDQEQGVGGGNPKAGYIVLSCDTEDELSLWKNNLLKVAIIN
jgi:hypothetical protein